MKLKNKFLILSGLVSLSLQVNAAGTISSPGWYYPAYPVGSTPTYATIFLKGAFADEVACQQAKWLDYDPSNGTKPWDGGAGCHYIHESSIDAINDIYSLAFNPGTDPIIALDAEMLFEYIQQADDINQAHDIKNYKVKMNRLIDSYSQPRR
ncbi:hypothetical protein [Marinicella litoralis]|uniref:Uncharacterized protein n=1 Tax=Marinicella litoralis TaxID=644220 RepID=A0A4R6XDT7_9GAMM|nr:hypothetical protein [Marinicella litoralis]TDR17462.1 hypothetical protein C8D91_2520 [Marinicella litoralis]